MSTTIANHYLLTKRAGLAASTGKALTARACTVRLFEAGIWPLWTATRNRRRIAGGDHVAVYLAGNGLSCMAGLATVAIVERWSSRHLAHYPLVLDGTPEAVLRLSDTTLFNVPVPAKPMLGALDLFAGGVPLKWGVYFMGGCRAISEHDFDVLTGRASTRRGDVVFEAGETHRQGFAEQQQEHSDHA
ncbi:MAG: hypothetical protein ABIW82_16825 [Dokdonella sp.]